MADVSKTISVIFQGEDRISPAVAAASTGIEKFEKSALGATKAGDLFQDSAGRWRNATGQFATDAQKAAAGLDTLGVSAGKTSTGVDTAVTSLKAFAAGLVLNSFVSTNVEMERFNLAMTSVSGSSARAGVEFEYVKGVADRLGLSLFATADNYVRLAAATKGTSLEGENTRLIFEAVSGAMAKLGRSSADTNGALLALSQIVSKGTVSMEELRGQIGERLPGAMAAAAKAMGLTEKELDKLVSSGNLAANDFLPKFALALNAAFGAGSRIDTYEANLNRLKNSIDQLLIAAGNAGGMTVLTGIVTGATGALDSATAKASLLSTIFQKLADPVTAAGGALRTYVAGLFDFGNQTGNSERITDGLNQSLAETARLLREAKEAAGDPGAQSAAETARLLRQVSESSKAVTDLNANLKALGVPPSALADAAELAKRLGDVLTNPKATGDQMLAGLEAALKRVKDLTGINAIGEEFANAFSKGAFGADVLERGVALLASRQRDLATATGEAGSAAKAQADQLKKSEEAANKAREAAERYKLEMEKLASNERIKLIEAKVQLSIANVEANAKIAIAAFESINNTINSTGTSLTDLFKLFAQGDLNFSASSKIRQQIDLENKRRDEALALQKRLIEAQILQIQAQTTALNQGDALIKIDGAGLQPHLEAFMFEILRAIQTRVNSQGLDLLLGVPAI